MHRIYSHQETLFYQEDWYAWYCRDNREIRQVVFQQNSTFSRKDLIWMAASVSYMADCTSHMQLSGNVWSEKTGFWAVTLVLRERRQSQKRVFWTVLSTHRGRWILDARRDLNLLELCAKCCNTEEKSAPILLRSVSNSNSKPSTTGEIGRKQFS